VETLNRFLVLLGRILLCLLFLIGGLSKIGNFSGTAAMMASKGIPATRVALVLAIVIEVAGALCVMVGFKARFWAGVMALYLIPVSLTFHNFWALSGMERMNNMAHFMKNVGLIGGLLIIAARGAGPLSVDRSAT
jgi:putative oxidoreductase